MCHSEKTDEEFNVDFKWGKQKSVGGANNNVVFYESCAYDGVEYSLYDCVYLYVEDEPEPYIGKLVKMWELPNHKRRIKVIWFFRPIEIRAFLARDPPEHEIFLASGEGIGLSNINPLEVLYGKCKVVCVSKDMRNPQPSEKEVNRADYIFYRTFDVGNHWVSDKLEDEIAGIDVTHFLNKKKAHKITTVMEHEKSSDKKRKASGFLSSGDSGEAVCKVGKDFKHSCIEAPIGATINKTTFTVNEQKQFSVENTKTTIPRPGFEKDVSKADKVLTSQLEGKPSESSVRISYNKATVGPVKVLDRQDRGLTQKTIHDDNKAKVYKKSDMQLAWEKGVKADKQEMEATRKADADRSKWFKRVEHTWEDMLQQAYEKETLILFQNLDPSYTSAEVEDIIYQAFMEKCTAKVIPRMTFSNPHNGQALVIFKSKVVAEMAMSKLKNECALLDNGRMLLACKGTRGMVEQPTKFVGHLTIDRKQRAAMRNAVSTSHFPQPNTLEYDMAVEWCLLQKRAERNWKSLYKEQGRELVGVMSLLKPSEVDLET